MLSYIEGEICIVEEREIKIESDWWRYIALYMLKNIVVSENTCKFSDHRFQWILTVTPKLMHTLPGLRVFASSIHSQARSRIVLIE